MTVDTNLSHTLDSIDDADATYNDYVKKLLSDKQILARIMKYTLNEFRDMEINDIIGCIGDDIEVGPRRPVDPGLSNLGSVKQDLTEDTVLGEGTIYYDIRFTARIKDKVQKFLINIEAQRSINPSKLGYHLENRIMYYLARMVSAQKNKEFFKSNYDDILPVRSIWICMDSDIEEASIREISFGENILFGNDEKIYNLNVMKAVVVSIRNKDNVEKSKNELIAMLEELISKKDIAEKKRILVDEFGMVISAELEGRIQEMCNWSEAMKERGANEERLKAIERMIKVNISYEQMISMGYTDKEIQTVKDSLLAPA